jgi:hypothetical protein
LTGGISKKGVQKKEVGFFSTFPTSRKIADHFFFPAGPKEETLLVSAVPLGQAGWWSGRGVAIILVTWAMGELLLERKRKTDQEEEETDQELERGVEMIPGLKNAKPRLLPLTGTMEKRGHS